MGCELVSFEIECNVTQSMLLTFSWDLFSFYIFCHFEGLLRCGKSCRLRWINYLRADLKRGNISTEEEEIIVQLHASLGNR